MIPLALAGLGALMLANPLGGKKAAASRKRLKARTTKSYVRALRVVRRRHPWALTMPGLSPSHSPSQAVWQRHAKVSRRWSKARWSKAKAKQYDILWRRAKPHTNPLGRCSTCGRPHVDPMTLNSWPIDKSMCYQAETGGDPRCKPRKGKKRRKNPGLTRADLQRRSKMSRFNTLMHLANYCQERWGYDNARDLAKRMEAMGASEDEVDEHIAAIWEKMVG